jgi:DNA-binding CsgD family transcriptional regulator
LKISTSKLGTEILDSLIYGETVSAIAEEWGISKQAVYGHLDKARRALGAATLYQAVAMHAVQRRVGGVSENGNRVGVLA